MISECVVWHGRLVATYQEELDEWLAARDDIDKTTYRCVDVDLDDEFMFEDTGGMLSGKTVLLIGVEEWLAPQMKQVLKAYNDMETDVRVGIVRRDGKEMDKYSSSLITEERDRRVPYDPEDMAKWMVQWLRKHQVLIAPDEALKVAHHIGWDVDRLVRGVIEVSVTNSDSRISAKDLIARIGGVGEADISEWTSAILRGDRKAAAENLERLHASNEFMLLSLLSKRFRAHVALAFNNRMSDADLETLGIGRYWARYVREDTRLSESQAVRVMQLLSKTDTNLKGGMPALDARSVLSILSDSLTVICGKAA